MFQDHPHKRFNPLTGEWVLVSPHRTKRPWQGHEDETEPEQLPQRDPNCYLCAGNTRAGGAVNPDYKDVFVFTNDFAALLQDTPDAQSADTSPLFRAEPETGICRVICFSPRHDLSLSRMEPKDVEKVVQAWIREFNELGAQGDVGYVQIFENRGSIMGCSNPHPHGQIWATRSVPTIPKAEDAAQKAHLDEHGECMLCRYAAEERTRGERIVFENDSFLVLVPFWALWPYEIMILPKEHMAALPDMNAKQRADLAETLVLAGIRYDNLFRTSFPYSMGIHQRPVTDTDHDHWHWHIHYYPPLLRSATVRKFMVGFEMMGMPQRDLTAEQAAATLRELTDVHYLGTRCEDR